MRMRKNGVIVEIIVAIQMVMTAGQRGGLRRMGDAHNILVISDLHLGEGLTPSSLAFPTDSMAPRTGPGSNSPGVSHDLQLAERQLVRFLERYTRRRADGRPWRLVMNGDVVDFVGMQVFPEEVPGPYTGSGEERDYGVTRRVEAACIQIAAVVAYHRDFFRALARFLAAGNRLEITSGNHDTEFFWPEVQSALTDGIVDTWCSLRASGRPGAMTLSEMRERIRFHQWFFHEPGVAWIEHGHQYDECCSYENGLHPVGDDGAIVLNVDAAAMRYLSSRLPERAHGSEEWSAMGYLRFAASTGPRGAWRLACGYGRFAASLVRQWAIARFSRGRARLRQRHRAALRELTGCAGLSADTLRRLDALQRPPILGTLGRLMQVLMLDKLLIWAGVSLAILVIALTSSLWPALALSALLIALAHTAVNGLDRTRNVDPTAPLLAAPRRILRHVDARYVIFGHTHVPVARRVQNGAAMGAAGEDSWYLNTGTWVPSGKLGLLHSFTHAIIRVTPEGDVTGGLYQWRDGASHRYIPVDERAPTRAPALGPAPGHTAPGHTVPALPGRALQQAEAAMRGVARGLVTGDERQDADAGPLLPIG